MFEAALIELYATLGTTYNLVSDDYFDILVVNIRCYSLLPSLKRRKSHHHKLSLPKIISFVRTEASIENAIVIGWKLIAMETPLWLPPSTVDLEALLFSMFDRPQPKISEWKFRGEPWSSDLALWLYRQYCVPRTK